MLNVAIIIEDKHVVSQMKKELSEYFKKDIYIESLEDIQSLLDSRTIYQFCIIDYDTKGVITDYTKYIKRIYSTYFIYYAKDYSQCHKTIGYNVIGFFTYEQIDILSTTILDYLKFISSQYNCYFKTEDGYVNFNFNEIIFFERNNRRIMLQTIKNQYYLINYSLNQIKSILSDNFIFINKSVIVNENYIKKIDLNNIITIKYRHLEYLFNLSTRKKRELRLDKKRYHLSKNDIKIEE